MSRTSDGGQSKVSIEAATAVSPQHSPEHSPEALVSLLLADMNLSLRTAMFLVLTAAFAAIQPPLLATIFAVAREFAICAANRQT